MFGKHLYPMSRACARTPLWIATCSPGRNLALTASGFNGQSARDIVATGNGDDPHCRLSVRARRRPPAELPKVVVELRGRVRCRDRDLPDLPRVSLTSPQ